MILTTLSTHRQFFCAIGLTMSLLCETTEPTPKKKSICFCKFSSKLTALLFKHRAFLPCWRGFTLPFLGSTVIGNGLDVCGKQIIARLQVFLACGTTKMELSPRHNISDDNLFKRPLQSHDPNHKQISVTSASHK